MPHKFTRKNLPVAVLLASGLLSGNAIAQLEEVIVTAQMREQSLQNTPIAITSFNQMEIDTRRIGNVKDLGLFVPNMQIADSPGGTSGATIAIRGASTINPAITWEPVVGLYLDGIFLGKNLGGIFEIAELERVEVLRGPQGTLYGKNTVGGAINLITRLPSEESGGQADLAVGNKGYVQGKIRLDTGTLGKFRASAAYVYGKRDGFYSNVDSDPSGGLNPFVNPRSSDEFNNLDSEVWRVDGVFEATDTLSLRYSYDSSERHQQPSKAQLTDVSQVAFDAVDAGAVGMLLNAYTISAGDNTDKISNDWSVEENADTSGHGFFVDWDAGNWGAMGNVSLKSISSYRELDYNDTIDLDGSPMDLFHSSRDIDYEQYSQEFQLLGNTDSVNYVLGVYYFKEKADVKNPITFFGLFGSPTDNNSYGLDNDSYAAFGQAEWRPPSMDQLSLTGGIRYTQENRDQYINHPNASQGGAGAFDEQDDDSWSNTSGTFIAGWDFTDDVNVYAKVAQGWKSGGFNGEAPTADAFLEGYDPEEVLAYELGMKSRFLDDTLQLNVAAFYNDTSDMQVAIFLEGSGGAASNVRNVGDATATGVEVELVYQVLVPLRLSVNYGYLDTEYDTFIDKGVDVKNDRDIPYSPENMASLALDWAVGSWEVGDLDFHIDWSYNDNYVPYIEPSQNATAMIDSYDILNASLTLSEVKIGSDMIMQFSLWGKNIADEEYRQNTIPFGLWTVSFFGDPATYGASARLQF